MEPTETNAPAPSPTPPAAVPPTPAAPEPPPAAKIVIDGGKTEHELALEAQLKAEQEARKKAETDAAYAQDEARRLKDLKDLQSRPPAPARAPKSAKARWTFFHDEED